MAEIASLAARQVDLRVGSRNKGMAPDVLISSTFESTFRWSPTLSHNLGLSIRHADRLPMHSESAQYGVSTVERALDAPHAFTHPRPELSLTEISTRRQRSVWWRDCHGGAWS
jgi:hypothetical protein